LTTLSPDPELRTFNSRGAPLGRASLRGGFVRSALPGRTQAGFAVAVLAIVAIAVLSYRSLGWRAEGMRLVAHTLEVTRDLDALLSTYKDAETGQRGYLLTGEAKYLEPYDAATSAIVQRVARLRQMIADNPHQLERLAALQGFSDQKMAELKQTIELRRAGRTKEALAVVDTDRGKQAMDSLRATVGDMKEAEQALLVERTRESERVGNLSVTIVVGGSVLLLLLVIGAALMSGRDFLTQRREAWLRAGESELGRQTQGADALGVLGDRIAAFLGQYVEARVAAVYFAGAAGQLRRVGAFGLPADAADQEPGGLTREAFRRNAVVDTADVPADFFPVSAGTGKARARRLIVAPTTADGVPNGVLELGFFAGVLPTDLALLRLLAERIGLALRAVQDRTALRDALEETQRQAEELQTQQEELSVQNEELEQQSRVLQDSQARLENQQAELEQINAHLEEQTQAVERQRDDLVRAQGELQRASTYKSEFLANMSHELRTPLNSSLILAKLLAENREGNLTAEQIKFAETIYSAGNDLLTLINDVLDLSKIEAGKLEVRPEQVAVSRLVEELGDVFRPVAQNKSLDLSLRVEGGAPAALVTDPTRLQQVLKNLLSNALKFTERGGVSLTMRRADGRVAFEVKDTGIGIPAQHHQTIFEAFRQADGTTNRKYGGTGLGLSISRDLARLLGGELTLESAPGRGSTFTLLIPERLEAELPPASPARVVPRPITRDQPSAPIVAAAPGARPAPGGGRRTLLIVEDDTKFASVLEGLARELDFEPVLAETGEQALVLADSARPDAIVLDVNLPDRSGLSVLDVLKHRSSTRHIPVHVVSGSDYAQAALQMGAAGYAIKPVDRDELAQALRRLETKLTQKVKRILVVEDDAVARDSTCRLLAGSDVQTVAVGTAAEALAQLGASTFDCMVLDLSLPDRSGFELLEDASSSQQVGFPPVIVYTGRSLSRDEEQRLRQLSRSIIIKGARSPERLLDEVTLFLHQVEAELPAERQRMLRDARHREAVFEGRRILVVEDDVRNIFALSSVLEPRGAKVEIARNGREALDRLGKPPPVDLVLMDVMMPEMDGLEAMRRIRAQPQLAQLPIIALTAKAMADDREQCLAAGANDYIAKPLDIDKLLSLTRVWMPK